MSKKLLLVTDAWSPQTNGVVRTLQMTITHLRAFGCETKVIHPGMFPGFISYPNVKLCWPSSSAINKIIREYQPDYIHIATEGPLGLVTRHVCNRKQIKFTTSYHTNWPEYGWEMYGLPRWLTYKYLRWFHIAATRVMVSTHQLRSALRNHGFANKFAIWSRGVDTCLFHPRPKKLTWPRPLQIYVGRVSKEKNLEAFLGININPCECILDMGIDSWVTGVGTKVIVGNGPHRTYLMKKYPHVKFVPFLAGEELAQMYAEADVFVFPSKSDTFGLVMLEALASGVPVAAFPICSEVLPGLKGTGFMHKNLRVAIETSLLEANPDECVKFVKNYYTWEKCSRQFFRNLEKCK